MTLRLTFKTEALAAVRRRHHIQRQLVFGSVLKGTNRPDSDADLLVEFVPGNTPGLLKLAVRTPQDPSKYFRDEVLRTTEVQYAA